MKATLPPPARNVIRLPDRLYSDPGQAERVSLTGRSHGTHDSWAWPYQPAAAAHRFGSSPRPPVYDFEMEATLTCRIAPLPIA